MTLTTPEPKPTETPNVVISNPSVRRVIGWIVGLGAVALPVVMVVDAEVDVFDLRTWTRPLVAAVSTLAGIFGLTVTLPNIPKK